MTQQIRKRNAREKVLDAALSVIRIRGYSATTVDDLCHAAGVTKGAFFHHFASKEALAVAAAEHWGVTTGAMFAAAPYHAPDDPLDRLLAYLDLRRDLVAGTLPEVTCLAGMLVQETYATSVPITAAGYAAIADHAATLEADFAAAIALYGGKGCPDAHSLALHTQTVLQGAFVMAKGSGDAAIVAEAIEHLRRYLTLLFNHKPEEMR